jgi:hypothetical protein
MSKAIEHIRNICKTQTVPEDEYKWIDPILELSDSIKALSERVEELEKPKKPITITSHWETGSSPPTGLGMTSNEGGE